MQNALSNLLPPEKQEQLLAISRTEVVKQHEYFVREGEVPNKFAFVYTGLFRYVYINDKGNEFTKSIITANNFISSYSATIAQTPSYFFIEALEDSTVLTISYNQWLELLETDPFWTRLLVKFVEKGFITKEKRERDLLLLNAETRYLNFLEEFPGIEKRINQQIIASYLGIQPESLSRIRKKLHG